MREITVGYTHANHIGYGRMGTNLHRALTDLGVDVYDFVRSPHAVANQGREKATNTACWMAYPSHVRGWLQGQRRVLFTMFETDMLPESFRAPLPNFDQILVPSEQNAEMFGRFHPNVATVPLGVDPALWHYRPRPATDRQFRFMVGGTGERKGGDLAYDAFRRVFGDWKGSGPEPWLYIKSPKPGDHYGERIQVISGYLSDEEEVDLYASVHCYLQPSRGEGFGLQPLQAIAQGIPTVLTGAHGHAGFAHLGWPLSARMVPSGEFMLATAGRGGAGQWWEPSLDELCGAMEAIYTDYASALDVARAAAAEVADAWTWGHSARHFLDAVGEEHLGVAYRGDGCWVEATEQRFVARVLRNYACEIGGAHYQWLAGRDYYETADVKRILLTADVLDPACMDPDAMGVEPDKADAYSGRHSYCVTCNQKLGSGLTRSDEIFAELEAEAAQV